MANLGTRKAIGALATAANPNRVTSGAWIVSFTPTVVGLGDVDFEVWHGAAKGPGGYFHVYIDDSFFGVGENGTINEYAPQIPMYVRRGQSVSLHWSIATGTAPEVTFWLREPEVGIFR